MLTPIRSQDTEPRKQAPGSPPHPEMRWAPGGTFVMGSDTHYREEAPSHQVSADGFWMDQSPVTNAAFRRFVESTEYVTFAEVALLAEDYPGALPAVLHAGSILFQKARRDDDPRSCSWWQFVHGADWRHPKGSGSSIDGLDDYPAVHLAYQDVEAYANWCGKQIPTEAEWEFAARGGLSGAEYAWGDKFWPDGRHMANTWQGEFPWQNLCIDGYEGTSPVYAFPQNGYGLYDMIGNVWEWTADWSIPAHTVTAGIPHNPRGGSMEASCEPGQGAMRIPRKVLKGGSYLSAPSYCKRYRPAGRIPMPVDTSICHVGFRCIVRPGAN